MIIIRPEGPEDIDTVREVNIAAFKQSTEADLVDKLRHNCADAISLVAEDEGRVVGHILFTPAKISGAASGMGLGPIAVTPGRQGEGIGSSLVEHGINVLRERGCPFVIVLGHAEYYPRFGFELASAHGLKCQWAGVPDEAFMVLILDDDAMKDVSGVAEYRNEFNEAM